MQVFSFSEQFVVFESFWYFLSYKLYTMVTCTGIGGFAFDGFAFEFDGLDGRCNFTVFFA